MPSHLLKDFSHCSICPLHQFDLLDQYVWYKKKHAFIFFSFRENLISPHLSPVFSPYFFIIYSKLLMCHLYVLCLFSFLPYFLNSLELDFLSTAPLKQFLSVFHWPGVAISNGHISVCLQELSAAFEITKCSLPLEISSSLSSTHSSLATLSQWPLFYLISLPLKLEHF